MHSAEARSPSDHRARRRRLHLLDVARALFVEQGFHQTGIAQIATASGIAVSQMYRDFGSKDAIIEAICERDVGAWLEEDVLAEAVAKQDLHAIRSWLRRLSTPDQPADRCQLVAEIIAEAGRNRRVAEIYRQVDARVRRSLSTALGALASEGTLPNHVTAFTEYILRLVAGAICRRIVNPQQCSGKFDDPSEIASFIRLGSILSDERPCDT